MNDASFAEVPSLDPALVERIDDICDRFEAAWQAREEPNICEFLDESSEPLRSALLKKLLLLELHYRDPSGETMDVARYHKLFPEHIELINSLFSKAKPASGNSSLADTADWSIVSTQDPNKPETPAEAAPQEKQFGRFKLQELLGRGGFGSVHRAHDPQLHRDVALKFPRSGTLVDDEDVQRFLREARAAAQLRHPNIVPVYEAGEIDGTYYIVSSFVTGDSLRHSIKKKGKPSHREAATLIAKLAEALHYAHNKGVIHRDIKPENVMIDDQGEPHIMDFGLARRESGEELLTQEGALMGTPAYMSPEQAKGESHLADARTDLWALGVMLYELLTGDRPFTGRGTEILMRITRDDPEAPRKVDRSIPKDLETICLKCLVKAPESRYPSCQHLTEELECWLRDAPIQARPISTTERTWRWCRRNPIIAGLAGTIALLLVIAAISSTVVAFRMRQLASSESRSKHLALENAEREAEAKRKAEEAAQKAEEAAQRERGAKQLAQQRSNELRAFLSKQYVDNGVRALDARNLSLGFYWFVKALELDEGDPTREKFHRMRVANTYRQTPRLTGILFHEAPITYAEFSLDGQRIVTTSYDNTARIWSAETGEAIGQPLQHDNYVYDACFSPDGELVATASADGTSRVWDAFTGEPLSPPLEHALAVHDVTFSSDSQMLATACAGIDHFGPPPAGVVANNERPPTPETAPSGIVWHRSNGEITRLEFPKGSQPFTVKFTADKRFVVTGAWGKATAGLWNTATGELAHGPFTHEMQGNEYDEIVINAITSDNNRLFATLTGYGITRVWDVREKKMVGYFGRSTWNSGKFVDDSHLLIDQELWNFRKHTKVSEVSSDILRVLHSAKRGDAELWLTRVEGGLQVTDGKTQAPISSLIPLESNAAQISADGRRILAVAPVDQQAAVFLWDRIGTASAMRPLRHWNDVNKAIYLEDQQTLATSSSDGVIRVWDLAKNGKLVSSWSHLGNTNLVSHPHAMEVLSYGKDGTCRRWNATEGVPLGVPLEHDSAVRSAAYTPDGQRVLSTSQTNGTQLHGWSLSTSKKCWPSVQNGYYSIYLTISPDGQLAAVGGRQNYTRVVDVETGQDAMPLLNHDFLCLKPAFHPSRPLLATPGGDSVVRVWEIPSGKPVEVLAHDTVVWSVDFTSDGERLLAATHEGLTVWDTESWKIVGPVLERGNRVRFELGPHDDWVVISGYGPVRIRELDSNNLLGPMFRHPMPTQDSGNVSFELSAAGKHLVSSGRNHACRRWDLSPDERSVTQLRLLSKLQLGAEIDDYGVLKSLSKKRLRIMWKQYKADFPKEVSFPARRCRAWLEHEALRLHLGGHYHEELEVLSQLLHDDPDNPSLLELRGEVAALVENDALTIEDLTKVVAAGFATPRNWQTLIRAYERSGRIEAGVTEVTELLDVESKNPYLWQLRGTLRANLSRWESAAEDLRKAIELGAGEVVYRLQADCLLTLNRWADARVELARAINFDRLNEQLRTKSIYAALAVDKREDAKNEFEEASKLFGRSQDADTLNSLAWIDSQYTHVNHARARARATKAVKTEPKNHRFLTVLAAAQLRCGDYQAAKERIDEAIAAHGDGGTWREWLLMAIVLKHLNMGDNARSWVEKARNWYQELMSANGTSKPPPEFRWTDRIDFEHLIQETQE